MKQTKFQRGGEYNEIMLYNTDVSVLTDLWLQNDKAFFI